MAALPFTKRLASKSDEALEAESQGLREAKRAFHREHGHRLKDAKHEAVDASVATLRASFSAQAAVAGDVEGHPLGGQIDWMQLVALYVAGNDPAFANALHEAIDRSGADFSPLSRAEYEAKAADYDREITERTLELERRAVAKVKDSAAAELAAFEKRAAQEIGV